MKDEAAAKDPDFLLAAYVRMYLTVSDRIYVKHSISRYALLKQIKKLGLMSSSEFVEFNETFNQGQTLNSGLPQSIEI